MMKLLFLIFCIPIIVQGQDSPGIQFEQAQSLQQVLDKAKAENKYVFVDCYTTWCGPCKKMDKEVYPLGKVGSYYNDKFISFKIQMDSTENDESSTKLLYADAAEIKLKYRVEAFPTLLYFNPAGQLVYKSVGMLDSDALINLGNNIVSSKMNYYQLLEKYKAGESDLASMKYLAANGKTLGDTVNSNKIAEEYIRLLNQRSWFKKENIEFILDFTTETKSAGFRILYRYADTINDIMNRKGVAESHVHSAIYKEMMAAEMEKAFKTHTEPNWNLLSSRIKKMYNAYYADRIILASKYVWFRKIKDWANYTKHYVSYIDRYCFFNGGVPDKNSIEALVWNNRAWEIFQYSDNPEELKKALEWSKYAVMIEPDPNWMDTYANLWYKLGEHDLAISWEKVAVKLSPTEKNFLVNLKKMEQRMQTWPASSN